MLAILATTASGQNANFPYDSIPMHEALGDETTVKRVQGATKLFAQQGRGNPNMARGYFGFYIPARMTAPDGVKHISELADETNTLLSRAQRSNRPQIATQLANFVFEGMKKVAEGNHHPAARINAVLILGRLDSVPTNPQTRTPPVPKRESLPILLALYQDENNVDGVRAAALSGLHRHANLGFNQIPDAEKATLVTAMTELLDSQPPDGRPARAHAYLQRYAVDIIDSLRPQDDKSLGVKLVTISTEEATPDLIALYSASRLGSMSDELKDKVTDPERVLASWSKRALVAFESELTRLNGLERPKPATNQPPKPEDFLKKTTETPKPRSTGGGMGGEPMEDMMNEGYDENDMDAMGMGMGDMEMEMGMGMGMGGMMGVAQAKPQPPQVRASRSKLNHVLQQLHLGVSGKASSGMPTRNPGGLLASVTDEKKPLVESWINDFEPIVEGLNDPQMDDQKKFVEGLQEQIELLRSIVGVEEEAVPGLPPELAPVDLEAAAVAAPAVDELAPVDELAAP